MLNIGGTLKSYRYLPERNVFFLVAVLHRLLKIIYELNFLGIFHFDIKGMNYYIRVTFYLFIILAVKRKTHAKKAMIYQEIDTCPTMNLKLKSNHIISEDNIALTHEGDPTSATLLDWGSTKFANKANQKYNSEIILHVLSTILSLFF
jgi:hypothetical protein